MHTTPAGALSLGAHGLLRGGLLLALQRHRMPSYLRLAMLLAGQEDLRRLSVLWAEVFHEPMPCFKSREDAEMRFVLRIGAERFPIADMWYEGIIYDDEMSILDHSLFPWTFGVPWEYEGYAGVEPNVRPLLALVAPRLDALADSDPFLRRYWQERGYDQPPAASWVHEDPDRIFGALQALPAPLDGLAGLLVAIFKESGNVFLDWPPPGYWEDWYDEWSWHAADIEMLTSLWNDARPLLVAGTAYRDWFDRTRDADRLVIETLLKLELGEAAPPQGRTLVEVFGYQPEEREESEADDEW